MVTNIEHVELVAVREGTYTVYVFKLVDYNQFIMCTRLPNWKVPEINVGDIGYLEYQIVQAGENYYNPNTEQTVTYQYSNVYFLNFVQKTEILQNNEIIL